MWRLRKNKMKNSIITSLVVMMISFNLFSQTQNSKPLFTFCGKSGVCTMTLDEFTKCSKEITPSDKNMKINSFHVSEMEYTKGGKDSVFTDWENKGNTFSKNTIDEIEKLIRNKKPIAKLFIENVDITQGDSKVKNSNIIIIKIK